jgi:hypothetical protein
VTVLEEKTGEASVRSMSALCLQEAVIALPELVIAEIWRHIGQMMQPDSPWMMRCCRVSSSSLLTPAL